MGPEPLSKLQHRLKQIARKRVGYTPNYSFFKDIRSLDNKVVTICSREDVDTGFNAMATIGVYNNRPVIHLGAVFSISENRGDMQLLYVWSCLFMVTLNRFRKIYFTSLTHTPKIFGAVANAFSNVFPSGVPDESPSRFHKDVREILIQTYVTECNLKNRPEIDDNFISKGFRALKDGTILFPDTRESVPKHRLETFNRYCLNNLDYSRGDEVLQVGIIKISNLFKNIRTLTKIFPSAHGRFSARRREPTHPGTRQHKGDAIHQGF